MVSRPPLAFPATIAVGGLNADRAQHYAPHVKRATTAARTLPGSLLQGRRAGRALTSPSGRAERQRHSTVRTYCQNSNALCGTPSSAATSKFDMETPSSLIALRSGNTL